MAHKSRLITQLTQVAGYIRIPVAPTFAPVHHRFGVEPRFEL